MSGRVGAATGAWGVFCACSWTWCIGMYLPILFLREYGWPGVLVFAVPNVLGCAAFGYVLRDRERARRLAEVHAAALRWFSIVVVAYHAWFLTWVARSIGLGHWGGAAAGLAIVAAVGAGGRVPRRAWPWIAAAVYALSLATFAALGAAGLADLPARGPRDPSTLAWLAPAVAAGFLLCPYLDATFHRALAESPSHHAFAVFAVTFAPMIALTLAYRDRLDMLAWIPFAHIATQAVFTVAAHGRELRDRGSPGLGPRALAVAAGIVAIAIGLVTRPAAGESIYIRFLVFFGLVFPLYVLLFVGPGRVLPRSRRTLLAYSVAVLAALPFYELGFLGEHTWLLAAPLVAFAAWKLLLPARG